MMKLTYTVFSTVEVIIFFAIGILGRRFLDSWLVVLDLASIYLTLIRILFVLIIIGVAIFLHTQITRFFIAKGWMKDDQR